MQLRNLFRKRDNQKIRKYFNELAPEWDRLSTEFYSEKVREKMLSMIYPEPGMIIADIGAGTGYLTKGLCGTPVSIISIDQSPEMLKEMQKIFFRSSNIDYRIGNSDHLPVKDNILDFAFANMYFHHIENPSSAMQEIHRTLRKGGKLVFADLDKHDLEFLREQHADIWLGFDRDQVYQWLTESGFTNVSIDPIDAFCCTTPCGGDTHPPLSIFMASGQKQ